MDKTIKALEYYLFFFKNLAFDYHETNKTWDLVLDEIFIKNTDIYHEFVWTLMQIGLDINETINYKKATFIIDQKIVIFKFNEKTRTLVDSHDVFYNVPLKTSLKTYLGKLGYHLLKLE